MKKAFTLAEVLITLGIIGVVAAFTLPTVINNTRNLELEAQLKKQYSDLNQISQLFMEHNGIAVPAYINKYGYTTFREEFYKYIKEVYKVSDWKYTDIGNPDKPMPYDMFTLKGNKLSSFGCDVTEFRIDVLGRYFSFDDPPKAGYNGPRICVDVNGSNKPNTVGLDIFYFIFTTDGFVIPEGQEHKNNNYESSKAGGGTVPASPAYCGKNGDHWAQATCGYYALIDKSPTGNGKYWKDFIGKKQYR